MINAELLKILCCPETAQALTPADPPLLERLNRQIAAGGVKTRGGSPVSEAVVAGLVRADGRILFPVRQDVPILLMDEAIPITGAA